MRISTYRLVQSRCEIFLFR